MRKYRIHKWYNEKADTAAYGIQTHDPENRRWLHCCRNKEPLIFDTEEQAEKEMNEIKFDEWKNAVSTTMLNDGWKKEAVDTIDWKAWKSFYFDERMSPIEAIQEDMANAL